MSSGGWVAGYQGEEVEYLLTEKYIVNIDYEAAKAEMIAVLDTHTKIFRQSSAGEDETFAAAISALSERYETDAAAQNGLERFVPTDTGKMHYWILPLAEARRRGAVVEKPTLFGGFKLRAI